MKVYWSLSSVPELAGLPAADQRRLWRQCSGPAFRCWQTWLALTLQLAGHLAGSLLGLYIWFPAAETAAEFLPAFAATGLGGLLGGLPGCLVFGCVATAKVRPHLRQARAVQR